MQAGLDAPCPPEQLFRWVEDLGRYPAWLDLVRHAEPAPRPRAGDVGAGAATAATPGVTGTTPGSGDLAGPSPDVAGLSSGPAGPAVWSVTLSASIGPLRRSKRLRMVRTVWDPPRRARFERDEADGRHHATWVLDAQVSPAPGGSHLEMELSYDGRLWGPVVEAVLSQQIDAARPKLVACATRP